MTRFLYPFSAPVLAVLPEALSDLKIVEKLKRLPLMSKVFRQGAGSFCNLVTNKEKKYFFVVKIFFFIS